MEILKVQNAEQISTVTFINDIADPLHFGTWGGLATKLVYFFAGLAISGLILTGVWISLRRKVKSLKQLKAQKMGGWKYVNYKLVIAMMILMYYTLADRYHASWWALLFVSLGFIILVLLALYLFKYKPKS
jgi:uncharacterized iron-regulated membrane protein